MSIIFKYKRSQSPENNYLRWLMDIVNLKYKEYEIVCRHMLYFKFYDGFGNDSNRTFDAVALRERFENETGEYVELFMEGGCGMLEMMVALAIRAADIMYDAHGEDQTANYFWVMFENLGLQIYTYGYFMEEEVDKILTNVNERRYGKGGKGGLWIVKHPPKAFRDVEIWSQMNWYLTEKWFEMDKN